MVTVIHQLIFGTFAKDITDLPLQPVLRYHSSAEHNLKMELPAAKEKEVLNYHNLHAKCRGQTATDEAIITTMLLAFGATRHSSTVSPWTIDPMMSPLVYPLKGYFIPQG